MNTSKINKVLNLAVRLAILVLACFFIFHRLATREDLPQLWTGLVDRISEPGSALLLAAVMLMMLLNWSLESLKWRYLIRKAEKISFFKALRAVFSGITVSTFTPNRTGEYFGRVFLLRKTNPWEGAFMTVVGSFSQFLITVITGSVSAIVFMYKYIPLGGRFPEYLFWMFACIFIIIDVILAVFYFHVRLFEPILLRFTRKKWVHLREHLKVFGAYSIKELAVVLAFSFARYAVFSLQFWLLLRLFLVPVPLWDGLLIIATVYFMMTAVPTVALSELGIRCAFSLALFDIYFANNYLIGEEVSMGAVAAPSLIWIINLVIPALIGCIFVMQLKFFRK